LTFFLLILINKSYSTENKQLELLTIIKGAWNRIQILQYISICQLFKLLNDIKLLKKIKIKIKFNWFKTKNAYYLYVEFIDLILCKDGIFEWHVSDMLIYNFLFVIFLEIQL